MATTATARKAGKIPRQPASAMIPARISGATAGTSVGATTSHRTPRSVSCRYSAYPVGPAS